VYAPVDISRRRSPIGLDQAGVPDEEAPRLGQQLAAVIASQTRLHRVADRLAVHRDTGDRVAIGARQPTTDGGEDLLDAARLHALNLLYVKQLKGSNDRLHV
jgi:hypothetical protein